MDVSPWYVRYGAKILGIVTAIVCFSLGIFTLFHLTVICILAGVLLIIISILVMSLEAPFCCAMVPQLQRVSDFAEERPPIQRIIFYGIAAILPIAMCFSVGTVLCALALGGSCAFNIWRYVKVRRDHQQNPGEPGGAPRGPSGDSEAPPAGPASAPGYYPGVRDHLIEKAAIGAVHGVVGGGQSGGYP